MNSMKLDYDIAPEEMELIENYLRNELSPEQSLAFNEKRNSDPNWANKIDEVKLLTVGLQEASLQQSMNEFHRSIETSKQTGTGKVIRFNTRWAVAASVILLVAVATWLLLPLKDRYEKLYAGYYTPDPGLLTAMSVSDNYAFEKGMVEYKNEEYEKALETWNALNTSGQPGDTLQYFLGMVNQALGRDDVAKKHLETIVSDSTQSFYSDACWYLGLILLKEKQTASAKSLIEKSNHPRKAELLNAINQN